MLYAELFEKILNQCSPDYIYRQLAEECCELAQAALKVVRMIHDETPATRQAVEAHYLEELADVYVMMELALLDLTDQERSTMFMIADGKRERWMSRLDEQRKPTEQDKRHLKQGKLTEQDKQKVYDYIEEIKQDILRRQEERLAGQEDDGR